MTTWRTREELVHQAVVLTTQGTSARAAARALGVSRNTVKQILRDHAKARETGHSALPTPAKRAPRAKKIDEYAPRVDELLRKYPDITAQRVLETLRDEGFKGGYTGVKRFVNQVRPVTKPTPSYEAPVFGPGEMAECDWSPYEITYTDGKTQTVQLFGYTLVFSRRRFFSAYLHADLQSLLDGHQRAFDRFGGCAATCKYDSQKCVVLRWEGTQQPIYNPRFLAFATHYGMRPAAVRGQPNAKPRVERSFWEHERSFLNGRSFRDFVDFSAQLAVWLDRVVDQRVRRGRSALDRFPEEAPHLLPLPTRGYDTARFAYRLCSIDGYVEWDGNRYAVPYDHVTDFLPIRITLTELFIYAPDLSCIATYDLRPRGRGEKIDPNQLHSRARSRQPAIDQQQLRDAFTQMGTHAAAFFTALGSLAPRVWTHHARQILQLRARYDTADVNAALGHAARFGALDSGAVARILAQRHPLRTLDEYVAQDTASRLDAILGPKVRHPRDLHGYDTPQPSPQPADETEDIHEEARPD